MFSCEFFKIFKNSFFIEHLQWLLLWENIWWQPWLLFEHKNNYFQYFNIVIIVIKNLLFPEDKIMEKMTYPEA